MSESVCMYVCVFTVFLQYAALPIHYKIILFSPDQKHLKNMPYFFTVLSLLFVASANIDVWMNDKLYYWPSQQQWKK